MELQFGLFGLVIFVLDLWAIITTLQSGKATGGKLFWVVIILLLPILGLILWLTLGRDAKVHA